MWFKPVKLSGVTADTVTGADLMSDTVPGADFRPGSLESALHWQVIWPRIIAKAWEDEEFHEKVKANPREAIESYFGYRLSSNLDLKIEDAPTDATFKAIAAKLTPGALVELQLSVGFYIMTSKFLETFGIDMQPVDDVV